MALTLTVGGRKNGFDRESFLSAMEENGITRTLGGKMINRLCGHLPVWEYLTDTSFLPEDLKKAYKHLLNDRIRIII